MAGLFELAMGRRDTMVHPALSQLGLPRRLGRPSS